MAKKKGQRVTPGKGRSTGQRKTKSRSNISHNKRLGASLRQRSTRRGWETSDRSFDARTRALHALALMRRDGTSLDAAATAEGTTRETVLKYLPKAFHKDQSGKWVATPKDSYDRHLLLPGRSGLVAVRARGSEEAKLASAYLQSLGRWIKSEKPYELASFHGKRIGDLELVTAASSLRAMRDAGLLQLDLLYSSLKDVA